MARRANSAQLLEALQLQGFDRSTKSERGVRLGCSQCQPLAINGYPCHEHGCPNETYECKGCNARVNRRGAYCVDCQ